MKYLERPVLVVAVDLTPLRPGGANGGIKPAIFSMIIEAARQRGDSLSFLFLTNSSTHEEVRRIAQPQDLLICVMDEPEFPLKLQEAGSPTEYKLAPPPPNFVQRVGADVLFCPFGSSALHAEGVPTVALIADLLHRDYPFTLTSAQISEREKYITQTVAAASAIQCISRSGVERLMVHYQVPEEKLFYTYLPVQVRLDNDPASLGFVQDLGIASPFFFYPANLWKHKNHETLLIAYRLYREQTGDSAWDLVLTFHEDARRGPEIRDLAQALGISRHLHLPGFVPEAGLRALWQSAGALVFPSLHEGFGIPLLEAMHYGVPIITGMDFSLKEIAGEAAYPIDARNPESIAAALGKVSRDPSLRESLKCKGRERLRFFDLKIETAKLLDVLSSLPAREGGFPRKPKVFETPYVLAVSTPASDALWSVEIRVNPQFPQNRYLVYLDDASFGAFSCSESGESAFRFRCRPRSRTLRVAILKNKTYAGDEAPAMSEAVVQIVAESPGYECVGLYQGKETAAL